MAMENELSMKIGIPEAAAENELSFQCPFCEKSFSSGKALGGHKRAHLLKNKNESGQSSTPQMANSDTVDALKCPICDQAFASEKALHGHMRKHPDRPWRGMKPPVNPEAENNLADEDDDDDDETGSDGLPLNEWRKAERRNNHGKAPIIEADSAQKKKTVELLEVSSDAGIKTGGEGSMQNPNPGPEGSIRGKNKLISNGGRAEKQKYVCDMCDRHFKSYQALGGHKSHHGLRVGVSDEGESGDAAGDVVPDVEVSPPVEEGPKKKSAVVFEFDLNEIPPPEEDE